MILRNPTDNEITVQLFGKEFTVEANGEISLPSRHGTYWKEKLHGFMEIISSEEPSLPAAPAPEEEVTEEVIVPTEPVIIEEDSKTSEKVRQVKGARRTRK